MKNTLTNCLWLGIISLLFACNITVPVDKIDIVDLSKIDSLENKLVKEQFFESIEYVKLETNPDCLIGNRPYYSADNKHIITKDLNNIFLFDRGNGKFIKKIGNRSKEPNGYLSPAPGIPYNEEKKLIYAYDWDNSVCTYDKMGQKMFAYKQSETGIGVSMLLNDSILVSYSPNIRGNNKKKLILSDLNGKEIRYFANRQTYTPKRLKYTGFGGLLFKLKQDLFFKEVYNDTIFHVTMNHLTPRMVIYTGKLCPPYSMMDQLFTKKIDLYGNRDYLMKKNVRMYHMHESDRFLFFDFFYMEVPYWGYYDKGNKKSEVLKGPITEIKLNGEILPITFQNAEIYDNELVVYIEADEFVEWLKSKNSIPAKIEHLKDVKETDNPIAVIIKLKK